MVEIKGLRKPAVLVVVGHYLPGFKAGGILRSIANMVDHLGGEFEFTIITRDRDLGDDMPYFSEIERWTNVAGARVCYLKPEQETMAQLASLIRETPHDVLYLNSFFEPLTVKALTARLIRRIPKRPVILSPRGEFAWASLRLKFLKKQAFLAVARISGLYRGIVWHASGENEANDVARWMRLREEHIRKAIDLPSVASLAPPSVAGEETRRDGDPLRVVFFSRVSRVKNLHVALRILCGVQQSVKFDIVGPIGDADYWDECEVVMKTLPANVESQVLGGVPPARVLETLLRYDLLLFPSGGESYGHVIGEALSVGTPVLISTMTPWRGLAEKGLGWDLPLENLSAFSEVIDTIAKETVATRASRRLAIKRIAGNHICRPEIPLAHAELFHSTLRDKRSETTEPRTQQQTIRERRPYRVCSRCVMDTSDSSLTFDEAGVCEYCLNFADSISPNWHTDQRGAKRLDAIAEEIRNAGKGKPFDCIIGLSGGLDSSYLTLVAKERLGLRPLLFHVDAGWNTDQAVGNIERLVDGLGLDLYTEVIDWEEMKDLQVAFLKSQIAHQDIPQDTAFFATLYKFARENKIKHILTGGNYSTECCREPEQWGAYPGVDRMLIKDIHGRFGQRPLTTFPIIDVFVYKVLYRYALGMQVVKPLDLIPYKKSEAENILESRFGWKKFQHKHHESRFTRFFEDFWLPQKFGYDRRRAHFSSLIMTGQMTRADALERLKKTELDPHFQSQEFEYVAHKLDLTVAELEGIFRGENKTCSDYRNKRWIIDGAGAVLTRLGLEKRLYK